MTENKTKLAATSTTQPANQLADDASAVEIIKDNSDYLRGSILSGLANSITAAIGVDSDDEALIKFHGIYQQDDRDIRNERAQRKLEPDYSFMLRLRIPGGLLSPAQWLAVDNAATTLTEAGSIRLTTRQTLQFHGIPKLNLQPLLQACAQQLLDSIAACGDVNRNVMCAAHPYQSAAHQQTYAVARQISERLLPASRAYYEIWLGEEQLAAAETAEPLYGKHYLPRKFKIGIAIPPVNDVDIYSQDIGFIAIVKDNQLIGFNVCAGGGLGMTHGDSRTYPRVGSTIGFCQVEQATEVAWHIAAWQRDYGDRSERKQARLKYTIDRRGLAVFRQELQVRLGFDLAEAQPVRWTHRGDYLGWKKHSGGAWDVGLFIENGRIATAHESVNTALASALRNIATLDICQFLITPNQNLLLINIKDKNRPLVEAAFAAHHIDALPESLSGLRQNAMACVALPTCPLAMAESERYLPSLIARLEGELARCGLSKEAIVIRMTGCPNGCARPYLAEIGLVGKSPGRYNLYLGASYTGERLSALAAENMNEEMIIATLSPWFARYASERLPEEHFGDFLIRYQLIRPPVTANDFHVTGEPRGATT